MMQKPAKAPSKSYDWPRRKCRNCKLLFTPRPDHHGKDQKFCQPNCRKEFEKHGQLPFEKLINRAIKALRPHIAEVVRQEVNRRQDLLREVHEVTRMGLGLRSEQDVRSEQGKQLVTQKQRLLRPGAPMIG